MKRLTTTGIYLKILKQNHLMLSMNIVMLCVSVGMQFATKIGGGERGHVLGCMVGEEVAVWNLYEKIISADVFWFCKQLAVGRGKGEKSE
ncbi:Uncharacterized protein TCM_015447 [Theobroma cacao]|uniref:Uncharacterized protein n=1 Tax=Theobroma cacao TaxID=3641 RepID=A0A061G341_THECC|nr:Uncharacterized protein TCM_015447 [Theobroma cacao]